jgi:hypothetical protein
MLTYVYLQTASVRMQSNMTAEFSVPKPNLVRLLLNGRHVAPSTRPYFTTGL